MKRKVVTRKMKVAAASKAKTVTKKGSKATTETFVSPESSNVVAGVYDSTSQVLLMQFQDRKDPNSKPCEYFYEGVTREHWDGLKTAESKGKYMLSVIRKFYTGVRVG